MKITIDDIRTALVRSNEGVGRPYPARLRAQVLAHVERRRRTGIALEAIAAELGLTATTLRKWKRNAAGTAGRPALRERRPTTVTRGQPVSARPQGGLAGSPLLDRPATMVRARLREPTADVATGLGWVIRRRCCGGTCRRWRHRSGEAGPRPTDRVEVGSKLAPG